MERQPDARDLGRHLMENPTLHAIQPRRLQKHLVTVLMSQEWMKQARCRGQDTDLFFNSSIRSAYRVCWGYMKVGECPVRKECLQWACSFEPIEDRFGVFGGRTPPERRRIRRGQPVKIRRHDPNNYELTNSNTMRMPTGEEIEQL